MLDNAATISAALGVRCHTDGRLNPHPRFLRRAGSIPVAFEFIAERTPGAGFEDGSFHQGSTEGTSRSARSRFMRFCWKPSSRRPPPLQPLHTRAKLAGVTCTLDGSGSGIPGGNPVQHHGLCCILACAAASCAYVGTSSAIAAFLPERDASPIRFVLVQELPARPPLNLILPRAGHSRTSDRARAAGLRASQDGPDTRRLA